MDTVAPRVAVQEPEGSHFKRLGAEAAAGAIADILWKSQRRMNKVRLFGTY